MHIDVTRALLGSVLAGLAGLACASAASPASSVAPPSPVPSGFVRVIVHSSAATPIGVHAEPAFAIGGPDIPEAMSGGPQTVDAFPLDLLCPANAACRITIGGRLRATVITYDPVVEVDIDAGDGGAAVRYRDAASVSARLGAVLATSSALRRSCAAKDVTRIDALEHELRDTAAREAAPVGTAARLQLVAAQCSGTEANAAIARALANDLDPTEPELLLWTDALLALGELTGDAAGETQLVDAVIARHPNDDVVAKLLLERLMSSPDAAARQAILARLREPRFVGTDGPNLAVFWIAMNDPLRVAPGDALPPLDLTILAGGTMSTATPRKHPLLLYFSASWCAGCLTSLPRLRELASEAPDLQIAYVLVEGAATARTVPEKHGPIPGTVAYVDGEQREALEANLLKMVVLPTFVLVDAGGKVIATSKDDTLDELAERLRGGG